MSGPEREALLEAATTAFRERDLDGRIHAPPAWWDLSPEERLELFERQIATRELEQALDPMRQSGTVRAVSARILGQIG
jgi:predicted deacetylase